MMDQNKTFEQAVKERCKTVLHENHKKWLDEIFELTKGYIESQLMYCFASPALEIVSLIDIHEKEILGFLSGYTLKLSLKVPNDYIDRHPSFKVQTVSENVWNENPLKQTIFDDLAHAHGIDDFDRLIETVEETWFVFEKTLTETAISKGWSPKEKKKTEEKSQTHLTNSF